MRALLFGPVRTRYSPRRRLSEVVLALDYRGLTGLGGILLTVIATNLIESVSSTALPTIQGQFGFSHDAGLWFTSLYISAEAVGMSFSPWSMATFSIRRVGLLAIALLGVSSVLLPFAPNLTAIYALRLLQGFSNGLTIPLLFTTALRVLTPDIRLFGLAVYALSTTFTSTLTTTLAALWADALGWQEAVGWQFIFFQSIPFCVVAGVMVWWGVPRDPRHYERFRMLDWRGMLLVILGFGSLSTLLVQGSRMDWFNSPLISVLGLTSLVSIPLLVLNEWFHPLPLFKFQLLGRRNFGYGAITFIGFLIVGSSVTLPLQYLRQVQGYLPIETYWITLEIALAQLLMLPALAIVMNYAWVDSRVIAFIGLTLVALACVIDSQITIDWGPDQFYLGQTLQAIGQPMVVMPLLLMASNAVQASEGPFASGIVNAPRAITTAASTWLVTLIMHWRGEFHATQLVDNLGQERWRLPLPSPATLSREVQQQVTILSLSDAFLVMAAISVGLIIVLLVLPVRTMPPRIQLAQK